MSVNELGKVTGGGGTPARKKGKGSPPGEIRTRKATFDELAELEVRLRERKRRTERQDSVSSTLRKSDSLEKDRETAEGCLPEPFKGALGADACPCGCRRGSPWMGG